MVWELSEFIIYLKEKKEREDKEREARIAQGLAESVNSARNVEQQKIDAILRQRNLKLFDVILILY